MEYSVNYTKEINEIFKEYWPEIYKFIYYKVQNKEEAEELTQETFIRVYPKIKEELIEKEKYRAYIYTIARNIITDLWRSRSKIPKTVYIDDENSKEIPDKRNEVEDKIVMQEAISQLKKDARQVLELRIIKGYSIQETAQKMNKSEGAVKSLQFRAVKSLKNILMKGEYLNG